MVRKQVAGSNQLEIAMYSYNAPAYNCQLNDVRSKMYVQIKHSLAHLQDLIPSFITYIYYTSQSRDLIL